MAVNGLYKISNPNGIEDDVQVQDHGGNEWSITKSQYIDRGHKPDYESLPSREEYLANK